MISSTSTHYGPEQMMMRRESETLLDHRDELVALVKGHKRELKGSVERWCDQGRGSVKEMWQIVRAIGQGESQIAVIDLELESIAA